MRSPFSIFARSRLPVPGCSVVCALGILWATCAPAQDDSQDGQAGAQVIQADGGDSGAMTDAQGAEQADEQTPADSSTNPASANSGASQISGREARNQRFRRQRSNRNGSNSSRYSANNSGGTNGLDYSAFQVVAQRNIFDPNRFPRSGPRQISRPAAETFALVGTMSSEKGTFAFFHGTGSQYEKALPRDGSIAGYKVTNIGADSVTLASGTNQLELRIGMQMRREEGGAWHSSSSAYIASAPQPAAAMSHGSAENSSSTETDPVLKRLMQKREQE